MNKFPGQLRVKPQKFRRFVVVVLTLLMAASFNLGAKEPSRIPGKKEIKKVLQEAYKKYKNNNTGKNASYIKALAEVDPKIFGITIVTADGNIYEVGNSKKTVSIQSISKVFTAAKVMQQRGAEFVRTRIGANATGLRFNSIIAIELHKGSASNPLVNAGAIQSTSWIKAKNSAARWKTIKANMDRFAGRKLSFNRKVFLSEVNDSKRNQAISKILDAYNAMGSDPLEATVVYTRQCSVNVSSRDLAVMGAVLANYGRHPITRKQVLKKSFAPKILAIMATAGLYDNSGDWLYKTGAPAKSGVGGGFLAIIPGKLAIGVVSPPLDKFGNSVRAQLAIQYIIAKLKLNPYSKQ